MKRSPMPPRRAAMKRTGPPNRKHPPRKKNRRISVWSIDGDLRQEQRHRIAARAHFRCERCGCDLNQAGMEGHHRKLRSQGGGDGVENLLALCPACHAWCHGHPVAAREHGWIVPSGGDPAARAVLLWDGRTVRLTEDGNYDVVFETGKEAG